METAIPQKFNIKKAFEEIDATFEKKESEDEIIARLSTYVEWQTLKSRLECRINSLEDATRISKSKMGDLTDLEMHGFKCAMKDLLVEELKSIIQEVEGTAEVIRKNKQNEQGNAEETIQ